MDNRNIKLIIEGALLAAGKSLNIQSLELLFLDNERPEKQQIMQVLDDIAADCEGRGYELKKTASGYRFQVRQEFSEWINRLWDEKPQRYSRAFLETLALIAYRQPVTRGDIEDVRGVSVSSQIIKTLQEREWVRVVGHRDVPGRPALYATTRQFLDYFNLNSLEELPPLSEIRDIDDLSRDLDFVIDEAEIDKEPDNSDSSDFESAQEPDSLFDNSETAESDFDKNG